MEKHNDACNFARRNRAVIAYRFIKELLGTNIDSDEVEVNDEESKIDIADDLKLLDDLTCMIDIWHNYLEEVSVNLPNPEEIKDIKELNFECDLHERSVIIHRKGATPSTEGYVVIPGSRGSYSYLVKPIENNGWISGYSLAHGAGRKMSRSKAFATVKHHHKNANELLITDIESRVV